MWLKNKRRFLICPILLAVLMLSIPAAQAQEDILDEFPDKEPVETTSVILGSFSYAISNSMTAYYPNNYSVYLEGRSATFQEYLVSLGDEVKAGDVLARFTKEKDELKLARLELNLDQAKQTMSEGIRQRKEAIDAAKTDMAQITDPYEKQIAELSLEYLETELEQYRYLQQKNVDSRQEALDAELAELENTELIAPADGIIGDINRLTPGDTVSSGEYLINIEQRDVQLLVIQKRTGDSSFSRFRYNLPVTVMRQSETFSGRVVYASDAIPLVGDDNYIYIELDGENANKTFRTASLTCDLYGLEKVPMIPQKFLKTDSTGNTYVLVLRDGKTQRRYVQSVGHNDEYALIPLGLAEGEILAMS